VTLSFLRIFHFPIMAEKQLRLNINSENPLARGSSIPVLGFGTWKADRGVVGAAVETALNAGWRHVDAASVYGNEEEIGQALSKVFGAGTIKREDVWVTSKLWCTQWENAEESLRQTLKDLKLEYLDLYLVHAPLCMEKVYAGTKLDTDHASPKTASGDLRRGKVPVHEVWRQMEALVEKGLVRNIGVSNWPVLLLADLLTYCKIRPVVNQIEISPYLNQHGLTEFCRHVNIHVTAYSPLGSGNMGVLQDAYIAAIAKAHKVSPAQVILRWAIQSGFSVLCKSTSPDRVKQNFDIWSLELSESEMARITSLERGHRACDQSTFHGLPFYS